MGQRHPVFAARARTVARRATGNWHLPGPRPRPVMVLLFSLGMLAQAVPIEGQVIRGLVVDSEGREPLRAVLVTLVDQAGRDRQRFLVDSDGAFWFNVPEPGPWSVRAARMGAAVTTLGGFEVQASDTLALRVAMKLQPVALPGINVSGEPRCELESSAGAEVQQVWEAARRILSAASLTDSVGAYRYHLVRYTRELDPRSLAVRKDSSAGRSVSARSPIHSLPLTVLADSGFAVGHSSGDVYYAPDGDVLLSDWFLETHCFLIRPGTAEDDALIGLEFRPVSGRSGKTDVEGVLWLSPGSGELHFLEFSYTNLPPGARDVSNEHVGGRVDFRGFDDGSWIVSTWYIRMPLVVEEHSAFLGTRARLIGIVEEGGRVTSARRQRSGTVVFSANTGSIAGVVEAAQSSPGLHEASVQVIGVDRSSPVDPTGGFNVNNLAAGLYQLAYIRPALKGLDRSFVAAEVAVQSGGTGTVVLAPPSHEVVLAAACGLNEWPPNAGVLLGSVIDPLTSVAVPGVEVTIQWQSLDDVRLHPGGLAVVGMDNSQETVTDATGAFRFCRAPTDQRLSITARLGSASTSAQSISVPREVPVSAVVINWR